MNTTFPLDFFHIIDYTVGMKAFYEKRREEDTKVVFRENATFLYPAHFHENAEMLAVSKGGYEITVNGVPHTVRAGELIFIDSYDIHSYDKRLGAEDESCNIIIPPSFLAGYRALRGARAVADPVVRDAALSARVVNICREYIQKETSDVVHAAAVDLLFALLVDKLTFAPKKDAAETSLIRKILTFAQENYRENASIAALSAKTGYSKEHLSRVFHRYMKIGFPEYINRLRLDYIKNALRADPRQKITVLLFDAGFGSVQAYYKAKAKLQDPLDNNVAGGRAPSNSHSIIR